RSVIDVSEHERGALAAGGARRSRRVARIVEVGAGIGVGCNRLFDVEGHRLKASALAAIDAVLAAELDRVRARVDIHPGRTTVALRMLPKLASRPADAVCAGADVESRIEVLRKCIQ